ncbi:MAG: TetR/AcrR family transcriptional regulator [bacterium]|nr:TetR/AcrR family transcriptional regulator [bacterium]
MITNRPERLFEDAPPSGKPGRSSDNRETYDDRLNHLLETATRVMAQVGYEKATMRAVAKASGCSLAGMYHYFDSKEKMLFLVQFRSFNSLLASLREKLHGVDDPTEQLRVMVRAHMSYFTANMAALKVCSHELDSLTGTAYDETRDIRREYYKLTRAIVERILASRAAANGADAHVATMCLFSMLNWLYRWYDPKRGPSPMAVAQQIADQFLSGLTAPDAADPETPAADTGPPQTE